MKGLITITLCLFSAVASAEPRKFYDFVGRYQVTSCQLEVNLTVIDKDPFCQAAEIIVTRPAENEYQLSFVLPTGQVLSEGALTQYDRKEKAVEDRAEFRGDNDSAIWFRSYKNTELNLFIDEKYEFWVSPSSGEISFIRAHGHVQDVEYKFTRWDYELIKM